MNKWIANGRLTADPELKVTPSGVSTCRFTVATNRKYKGQDNERKSDFITCQAWRQTAEFICKYFHKGSMIILEGTLQNNDYTDNNNVKHYGYIVQVESVEFGESKNSSGALASTQTTTTESNYNNFSEFEEILGDEPPF